MDFHNVSCKTIMGFILDRIHTLYNAVVSAPQCHLLHDCETDILPCATNHICTFDMESNRG